VSHDGLLAAGRYLGVPHTEHCQSASAAGELGQAASAVGPSAAGELGQSASALAGPHRQPAGDHLAICAFAPGHESVRAGREFTRTTLRRWGIGEVSDRAELVVSELVTNALRHGLLSARWMPGEHPIRLRLLRHAHYLMCMVTDPGSGIPVRRDPATDPDDEAQYTESGRGLQVVETCSLQWGWQLLDGRGKVVWALLRSQG
jgi:anti-sigma regulatory factor (Ser/Thr protein kinase)